jgi:hypothetical protein
MAVKRFIVQAPGDKKIGATLRNINDAIKSILHFLMTRGCE